MNLEYSQLQTKVRFLLNELSSTQEELKEFKQLLDLNKEMIKTMSKDNHINTCQLPTTTTSKRLISPPKDIQIPKNDHISEITYKQLFDQLTEENQYLYQLNSLLTKQRDEARGQALVYDQIAESAYSREVETTLESQNKINSLHKLIQDKEDAFSNLENQIQKKKFVTKQVISATSESLHMHSQYMFLEDKLSQMTFDKIQLKEEKNELIVKYKILQDQIQNQLVVVKSKREFQQDDEGSLKEESLKQFNEGESSHGSDSKDDPNDSILDADLPNKVRPCVATPKASIPILNMKKAQKVQKLSILKQERQEEEEEINFKQQKLQQSEPKVQIPSKHSQTPSNVNMQMMFTSPNKLYLQLEQSSEQLKVCQKELGTCRFSLQDELFKTKNLEDQIDKLLRRLEDCYHRNDILLVSQLKYEQKWVSINKLFHEYYNFFMDHRDTENQVIVLSNRNKKIHQQVLSPRSSKPNIDGEFTQSLLQFPTPGLKQNSSYREIDREFDTSLKQIQKRTKVNTETVKHQVIIRSRSLGDDVE